MQIWNCPIKTHISSDVTILGRYLLYDNMAFDVQTDRRYCYCRDDFLLNDTYA